MTEPATTELSDAELEEPLRTWAGRLAAATAEFLRQRFRFCDDAGIAIDYAPSVLRQAHDLSAYTLVNGDTLTRDWHGDPLTRDGLGVIVDTYVSNRAGDECPGDPWSLAA